MDSITKLKRDSDEKTLKDIIWELETGVHNINHKRFQPLVEKILNKLPYGFILRYVSLKKGE